MEVIIYISNYFNDKEFYQINSKQSIKLAESPHRNKNSTKLLKTELIGIDAFFFIKELQEYTYFRDKLYNNLLLLRKHLFVKIIPPQKEFIDYKWNRMTSDTLWEKIEVDHLMSWLSTLGGGFSALGEQFSKCAETAGKISLKQLELGLRLGDPFLQARCKLYYSISLIQTGRLRIAKHIIREQYRFAIAHKTQDSRLVKMCHGIWHRLQYEYKLRQTQKQNVQLIKSK